MSYLTGLMKPDGWPDEVLTQVLMVPPFIWRRQQSQEWHQHSHSHCVAKLGLGPASLFPLPHLARVTEMLC
jgi:hypothetical protein